MSIRLRKRSKRWLLSFGLRTAVLMTGFLVLSNIGLLLAEVLAPDTFQSLRAAIGGSQYPFDTTMFLALRGSAVIPSFGVAMAVVVVLAIGHLFTFGPKDMRPQGPEDLISWWTLTERVLHAILAVTFLILMISGLAITFGRTLGGGNTSLVLRIMHEYAGLVFTPVLVVMGILWLKNAIPHGYDVRWFLRFGGYLGYQGVLPAGKFNAGQKLWYWIMAVCGLLLAWTGLALFFQYGGLMDFRLYVLIHLFSSIPIILMFLVHLYLTTVGVKGPFISMVNGKFGKTAAQTYHSEAAELKALGVARVETKG